MSDNINNPSHYNFSNLEVIDVIENFGLDFHRGNAVKYLARAGRKGDDASEDLQKALWYINRSLDKGYIPIYMNVEFDVYYLGGAWWMLDLVVMKIIESVIYGNMFVAKTTLELLLSRNYGIN